MWLLTHGGGNCIPWQWIMCVEKMCWILKLAHRLISILPQLHNKTDHFWPWQLCNRSLLIDTSVSCVSATRQDICLVPHLHIYNYALSLLSGNAVHVNKHDILKNRHVSLTRTGQAMPLDPAMLSAMSLGVVWAFFARLPWKIKSLTCDRVHGLLPEWGCGAAEVHMNLGT